MAGNKSDHEPAGDGDARGVTEERQLRVAETQSEDGQTAVVGVGASAGGLEAFSDLLRTLPSNPGFAIIFVQHITPTHESALATLLAATTEMPVVQPSEDTRVEADHVYVIAPNKNLTLRDGTLLVHPRPRDRTQYTPIDTLFHSLAKELGSNAVGVILSGTASDGVEGVHAIKAAGGAILVQDPDTAKQNGMPLAAMATGKVDLVLKAEEIGDELLRLVKRSPVRESPSRDGMSLESGQLEQIFSLLRASSGVDFGNYKLPTVQRRIQRRMALHKVGSVDQYLTHLRENNQEVHQLYQDILIHVTRFFREPESFQSLAEETFSNILENRPSDAPVRIWVPACSTGEEPYSVAITLVEYLDHRSDSVPIQIFATDISETAIDQARAGLYPPSAVEDLPPERLRRFFTKTDGQYRVNKPIRDLCVFARQDLTRDPPFSKLDLIVCRNVLIYLSQAIQSRLISVFHYALKDTSYLMLGSAETIGAQTELFAVADKKHRIYRKKLVALPADVRFAFPYARPVSSRGQHGPDDVRGTSNVQAEVNRLILERYTPPGVVVNDELRILQFRGQTGRFLEPAPGDASLNLLKMCREGLLHGLRTALQAAKKKDAPVRREGLRVKTNGDFVNLAVEVIPIAASGEGRHYLILFQDVTRAVPLKVAAAGTTRTKKSTGKETEAEVERLQTELLASREYLQSIIQDLEAANEELQSANEEILSSNEELQSTNEELDTAKEELQSTNEELNTVNEELHGRNEELTRINSDLMNLINVVQMAIVIVAGDLRIRRFTSMAERILNLIPGDVGRPIGQIKPNIDCPDLEAIIREVIDTVSVQQREVHDSQGRALSLIVRPYKSADNRIDGVVLALTDIEETRRTRDEAQEAREYVEAVFNTVREPLVVLDRELRVERANPAFYGMFNLAQGDVERQLFCEISERMFDIERVREKLDEVLTANQFEGLEIEQNFPRVGKKKLLLSGRRISGSSKRSPLILLALDEAS
ncbi:MAG TPA: CheR family methyltransferase [Pirellulaceae bacterium]|jgi:two-component system CheB/CheR fusion protein